jgi:DNA-binding transcriptional LysR family regulator
MIIILTWNDLMRELPNLSLFTVFESAARLLSFTRAAEELNVQQPAVSRQIAALESEIGTKLFLRSKPVLTLTPEGEALFSAVSSGLNEIQRTLDGIRDARRKKVLVVNAAIGFASCFLIPRLAGFQTLHPEIEMELVTRDQNRAFDPRLCDVVVVFQEGILPCAESKRVFAEELCAVCAPQVLPDGEMLSPAELASSRLLHLSSPEHAKDWETYLAGSGSSPPLSNRLDRFISFMVYLHAIQLGNGIGLGWSHITDDLIATGRLRLASERKVKTARGYHCCILDHARDKPEAHAFMDWVTGLCEEKSEKAIGLEPVNPQDGSLQGEPR